MCYGESLCLILAVILSFLEMIKCGLARNLVFCWEDDGEVHLWRSRKRRGGGYGYVHGKIIHL